MFYKIINELCFIICILWNISGQGGDGGQSGGGAFLSAPFKTVMVANGGSPGKIQIYVFSLLKFSKWSFKQKFFLKYVASF